MLPEVEADQRIYHLLNDFEKRYTGQDFGSSGQAKPGGTVTPDMLESVSSSRKRSPDVHITGCPIRQLQIERRQQHILVYR